MFHYTFEVSGVTTYLFVPPLVTFVLAYFGSMAGVTGAFLLLPFQMSVLGYTAPGVSATNFTYNIIAIPGTVFRYIREGRMNWPLALVITIGSCPGIVVGYLIRVNFLVDPQFFKPFVGIVLLYLAWLIARSLFSGRKQKVPLPALGARIKSKNIGIKRISYWFDGAEHSFDPRLLFMVAAAVGTAGGAFGIGGGAVLAPFCISVLRLPVHSVAGASLFGTFMSSVIGIIAYQSGFMAGGLETAPDLVLGAMFGIGGLLGGYLGAKTQKYVPEKPIKVGLLLVLLIVSGRYIFSIYG